jgi:hypothetical protein
LALPEFQGEEATRSVSQRRLSYARPRADSLYERILVERSKSERPVLVSFHFAISFFPECPIPSGAFGFDAPLTYLLNPTLRTALNTYWWGVTWYVAEATTDCTLFECFRASLKEVVRPKFEEWARALLDDGVAKAMVAAAVSRLTVGMLEKELKAIALEYPSSPRAYPTGKLVAQLLSRAKGIRKWYLV